MIVLDTHIWLWWVGNPEKLSEKATAAINNAIKKDGIAISSISTWEIALLIEKGRLQLTLNVRDWVRKTESLPFVRFTPVDNMICLRSVSLPGTFHPDPADRVIVATAILNGSSLVTKDEKIRSYPFVKTVWD